MTSQEIIDAIIAGGDAKDRARAFLSSGSREAYNLLCSPEFVKACTANAEAMGVSAPEDDDEDDVTECPCCGQPFMWEAYP